MELESDAYKKIVESQVGAYEKTVENLKGNIERILHISMIELRTFQIVIHQKGLNDLSEEGFSRYARVMFKTEEGEKDEDLTLDFNVNEITRNEIAELNNMAKSMVQMGFGNTGLKIIEWYPLKMEKINGMSCMHTSYKRQLNNNEPVIVNNYKFFNYDYNHTLIMSYRLNENEYWEGDFKKILDSLRIIK
jgi:hypothetical protein